MNLDQYRAIKAQEAQQSTPTEGQTPVVAEPTPQPTPEPTPTQTEPKVDEPGSIETQTENTPATSTALEKVVIEGVGEVDVDELKKGYLRQSDYTRKTQEISTMKKETEDAVALYQYLRQNPQFAQQMLQGSPVQQTLNPESNKLVQMEEMMYDLMLQNDIRDMQNKYEDFNTESVLKIADSRGITNLEDAYLIYKATKTTETPNMEEVKKQIREELVKELAKEQQSTQTLIKSGGTPIVQENKPTLSEREHTVAANMGLSDEDYIKWRDVDRKK